MIAIVFKTGEICKSTYQSIYQYNYGQVLRIQGLNLPPAVEVHFSTVETGVESIPCVGVTKDGVTEVSIPDSLLKNNDAAMDYNIYAYIFVSDETSGQTKYKITIHVKSRTKPGTPVEPGEPEPHPMSEIMEAINKIAAGKADGLEYEENILKLMSGEQELSRITIQGGGGGADAREIELRKSETAIQWRYVGEDTWKDLVPLSEIAGKNATDEQVQQAVDAYMQGVDFDAKFAGKVDKQQGVENAGKALVVGKDGNVMPGEVQGGDGIPIINTMSGASPLVVPDSAERVNKGFGLIGNTEQVTTTGKNLFNYRDFMDSSTYMEYDPPGTFRRKYLQLKPNTTYFCTIFNNKLSQPGDVNIIFVGEKENYDNGGGNGVIAFFTNANKQSRKIQTGESGEIVFKIKKNSDPVVQEEYLSTADIILSEGSTEIPYEPYTGGKPSPSTEYPQEIKNVGKWNEEKQKYEIDVKVTGKNLFDIEKARDASNWIMKEDDGYIRFPIRVKKGNKITFSYNEKLTTGKRFYLGISLAKQGSVVEWLYHDTTQSLITNKYIFIANEEYVYLICNKGAIQNFVSNIHTLQIEISDVQTFYQPYKSQILTLTSDRPITKWDKLVEQDGQIGWLYKSSIAKNINGDNHTVALSSKKENLSVFTIRFKDAKKTLAMQSSDLFCDKFKAANVAYTKNEFGICSNWNDGVKHFNSPKEGILTLDAFKEWIKANPITLAYETEDTTFIPLPQSEQDAIRALTTYYPTTVIVADGGEVVPGVELTYTADTKNYIDQKIAAIGKSVVATQMALL